MTDQHTRPADVIEITDEMWDASSDHERAQACPAEATSQVERVEALVQAWDAAASMVEARDGDTEAIRDMLQDLRDALAVDAHPETPDPHHDPRPWQDCTRADIRQGDLVERPHLDIVFVGVAHAQTENGDWITEDGWFLTNGDRWALRRIPTHATEKETPMTKNAPAEPLARTLLAVPEGHGAPHHGAKEIKAGDYVMEVSKDGVIRAGRAHHQDQVDDWVAGNGGFITWAALRADRPDAITVWPAPTPPAEEVEMPSEPRRLTDVVLSGGETIAEATWTGAVLLYARHPLATSLVVAPADQIEQWTLDGTRARRDGDRADRAPRFVKVQVGEK